MSNMLKIFVMLHAIEKHILIVKMSDCFSEKNWFKCNPSKEGCDWGGSSDIDSRSTKLDRDL